MLIAVLLMIGLASSASAYYDPEQGRFISRDPIGATSNLIMRNGSNLAMPMRTGAGNTDVIPGRIIERDPFPQNSYVDGPNLYQYARSNSLKYLDPDGQWVLVDDIFTGPVDEIIVLGAAAAYISSTLGDDIARVEDDAWDAIKETAKRCRPCKYRHPLWMSCGKGFIDNPTEALEKGIPTYLGLEGPFVVSGSIKTGGYNCAKKERCFNLSRGIFEHECCLP